MRFFFWAPSVFAELLNQLEQHKQSLIEDVDEQRQLETKKRVEFACEC